MIDSASSHGRNGLSMREAPAAAPASRNVPNGRQQLTAATRLPSAAIDDTRGPRACAMSRFLHNLRALALGAMNYNKIVATDTRLELAISKLNEVRYEIPKVIVGQQDVVEGVIICLIASGHVLLEGVPGLGKTTLLRTMARALQLKYSRIQFTPDLMPADIVGSMIMETSDRGSKSLRFQPGPIFANLVLADEINRATPKTQSALLEAMQERTVTSGNTTHELEAPFLVMATQNPIEMEGTYPLPEAQLDRFLMKILVRYPSREELNRIVERTIQTTEEQVNPVMDRDAILEVKSVCREVLVAPHVQEFAIQLVMATQPEQTEAHELSKKYIRYGSSPRGAQALVECGRVRALMRGRYHLSIEDIDAVASAVLRHRIILNFDAHADGQTADTILTAIIRGVSAHASAA
jgi:MoxR-like ATPase